MLQLTALHHIAIICSDYALSKKFYTQVLGFKPIKEIYRAERRSYKLDLELNGTYLIELYRAFFFSGSSQSSHWTGGLWT